MAGISVPQYEIFKIGTNKLKYYNWDLKITKKEAKVKIKLSQPLNSVLLCLLQTYRRSKGTISLAQL